MSDFIMLYIVQQVLRMSRVFYRVPDKPDSPYVDRLR